MKAYALMISGRHWNAFDGFVIFKPLWCKDQSIQASTDENARINYRIIKEWDRKDSLIRLHREGIEGRGNRPLISAPFK